MQDFKDEEDTEVHELPFDVEGPTQPMIAVTMAELQATPPQGTRVRSRDLEAPVIDLLPRTRTRSRDISDGVPLYVPGERARKITKPLGSRGNPRVLVRG